MTIRRILASLLVGAMVGGLLFVLSYLVIQLLESGGEHVIKYGLSNVLAGFLFFSVVWFVGILLVGSPFWFFMHREGKTSWKYASSLGFGLVFIFIFLFNTFFAQLMVGDGSDGSRFSASDSGGPTWVDNQLTLHGWASAAQNACFFALAGMLVALSLWWAAYKARR